MCCPATIAPSAMRELTLTMGKPLPLRRRFTATTKYCPKCDTWLPNEFFNKSRKEVSGLTSYCKPCTRRHVVHQKFGLTAEEHNALLKKQNYRCGNKGCGEIVDRSSDIDHDRHCCPSDLKTCGNCVRGILCKRCNKVLGFASDDITLLQGSIDYLKLGKLDKTKLYSALEQANQST